MDNSAQNGPSTMNLPGDHTEQEITRTPPQNAGSSRLSVRRVFTFILVAFVYFLTWSCTAMWAPFFPGEAGDRGVSSTVVGFIFGTYNLVAFLASLIYGPILIPRIGPYFLLFAGLFLNGGANAVCSFVNLVTDTTTFAALCFLVRGVGALGGAACETAIVVILTEEFKDNLPTAIGTLELFTGLGFVVGPVLGGLLYSAGGFKAPFMVTGGFLLLSLPFIYWLLPRKEYTPITGTHSLITKAMTIPGVLMMCMSCFIIIVSMSYIDPTLEPHAEMYGLNSTGVALLFLCLSVPYMASTPIGGCILNKKPWGRAFIVIGSLGMACSTLFFGPAPFLTSFIPTKKLWILVVSFIFCGFFAGIVYVPILPEMLQCCHERGLSQGLTTNALASGLYTGFCNLGSFAGPVLGGILNDNFGFPWTSSIAAFLNAGQSVILVIFFMCNRRRSSASYSDEETQPLIRKRSRETLL